MFSGTYSWLYRCVGNLRSAGSVLVRFVPPMSLPEWIPAESARFDGRAASINVACDTLRVTPDPAALPTFCLHDRPFPFTLVFLR